MVIEGIIVDIFNRKMVKGAVEFSNGVITNIEERESVPMRYIIPGFIDAHVHIESSMLTPQNFGAMVARQGTVAVVTDPHEIANVLGVSGVEFMVENGSQAAIKIYFSIPSSVPATPFDVAGSEITALDVEGLAASGRFVGLSEVMNVPGVLYHDPEVMRKLEVAQQYNLAIDGHAPMVSGEELARYIGCGITTDHECVTLDEAREKIARGMKILIREGSAAKNYDNLKELIATNPDDVMFCTDDSHPDDTISHGHINKIVRRAIEDGFDLFDLLKIACLNPVEHYKLDVGALRVGDKADFMVVDNLRDFGVESLYVDGCEVYSKSGDVVDSDVNTIEVNNFNHEAITINQLEKRVDGEIKIIGLIENEIVTRMDSYTPAAPVGNLESDIEQDIVKIVYINRYTNGAPQVAFCRGFGLERGAIASSIAHDSHNIIAVGCSDKELCEAINLLIENRGALVVCDGDKKGLLPLPIAGIMSDRSGEDVAADYGRLQAMIRQMGSNLTAPFMTLSFLSLVVIPEVKISERGLFSFSKFDWI